MSLFFLSRQKIVLFLELTVPQEDRVPATHTIKVLRYNSLLASCESYGWAASHFSFEFGCRGFVAHSLLTCLKHIGFPRWWAKKVRRECSRVVLRCSYFACGVTSISGRTSPFRHDVRIRPIHARLFASVDLLSPVPPATLSNWSIAFISLALTRPLSGAVMSLSRPSSPAFVESLCF